MSLGKQQTDFGKRFKYLMWIVVAIFAIMVARLFQLQIVEGATYQRKAENNFLHKSIIAPVRGLIEDRNGKVLVHNRPSYNVYIIPRFFTEKSYAKLRSLLKLDDEQIHHIEKRIIAAQGEQRYFSLPAVRDIDRNQLAILETNLAQLSGVRLVAETKRIYPYGPLAAHVLGYLNEVSAGEVKRLKGYHEGDRIGRYGVERRWEFYLRGIPGLERYVVDARGRKKSEAIQRRLLGSVKKRRFDPRPGYNLVLTLDADVQKIVERALRWHRSGAAVVVQVNTGRILAMASKPSFDPNMLSGRLSREQARKLYDNPYHPMLDKVLQGSYFPGSTYKVIPAVAALEERLVDPSEIIYCKGYIEFGKASKFRCSHVHGPVNLHYAIVRSCNVFFYRMAERIGMDRMARYARDFGLGTPTGLGLNSETGGFIPTKAWYNKNMPGGFRIGNTLNSGVGQGNVLVTPLQLAMVYAAIANGGKLYLPQIVDRIETPDGQVVQDFPQKIRRRVQVSPKTLNIIRSALHEVINDPLGTAYDARIPGIDASGKTGTAQVAKRGMSAKNRSDWWRFMDHAWFASYAPTSHPQIVVVVLIEHGGSAARVAAPVALKIIRDYFALMKSRGH
ncbi:MAG: penicillin-binding protein 2 [Deltaproteobacteria bacterium]|nr:penicillin-binding protein 2 [Deltaproteobacteria bacterium]